uniref:Uncharacterized protein n=1 Tax=Opuntia streptacantha TaxID=393608 RepID=A0A7C9AQZ2_OPUST
MKITPKSHAYKCSFLCHWTCKSSLLNANRLHSINSIPQKLMGIFLPSMTKMGNFGKNPDRRKWRIPFPSLGYETFKFTNKTPLFPPAFSGMKPLKKIQRQRSSEGKALEHSICIAAVPTVYKTKWFQLHFI